MDWVISGFKCLSCNLGGQIFYFFGCKEYNQSDFGVDHLLAPNDLGSSSFGILSFCLFILFMWPPYCPLKMPGSLLPWNLCNVPLEGVLFSMLSIYLNPFTYIKAQISPFQWSLSELAYFILQLAQPYSICLPLLCFL